VVGTGKIFSPYHRNVRIRCEPNSLSNSLPRSIPLKPTPAIKVALREPLKEIPKELIDRITSKEGEAVATLIKAIRPLTSRQLLVYPKDERARETLLRTGNWLESLQADAELYSRSYFIVIHGIDKALNPDEIAQRL
jgi:hypothetical protein